jgi:A/G-specific adenine glycosylase
MGQEYQIMTVKTETAHIRLARSIRAALLDWYDAHRRDLPWRVKPGRKPDPYAVWLSEIMLQQTTVATVGPYFGDFMARWPTVEALAAAHLDDVLVAWQGLGYYARARNLHKCAGVVATAHGGVFPDTLDGLQALPGIGPYTASAIAAIAFNRAAMPVDGNIERVTARLFAIDTPLPAGKADIAEAAKVFTEDVRPGDFAQAMMDLGATVCTPGAPKCLVCPLADFCRARAEGDPARLPVRARKAKRPERRCVMYWIENPEGAVLLRKRPAEGLLGGMTELPSTPWRVVEGADGDWPDDAEIATHAPLQAAWERVDGEAVHVFTHFRLTIRVMRGHARDGANAEGFWVRPADFSAHALPTVIKKAVKLARDGA